VVATKRNLRDLSAVSLRIPSNMMWLCRCLAFSQPFHPATIDSSMPDTQRQIEKGIALKNKLRCSR
jgi:hypothetical protein